MVTGVEWGGPETIEGIKIQKECKLLGVVIDNKGKNINANWEKCKTKVRGLISYWNQYNLTLTGRVLVAKTFFDIASIFSPGNNTVGCKCGKTN
jgi:hypothetical protein